MSDLDLAVALAGAAGDRLLDLRAGPAGLTGKDLGKAGDRISNEFLLTELQAHRPHDAVLSEESADSPARLAADRVWIIDPLDGTREYGMPGREDWAVHVALWTRGIGITSAAVAQPALGAVYSSADSVRVRSESADMVVLVSDSRPPDFAPGVAARVGATLRPMGSAGAKAMAVLRGDADAYVHAGGQWEWDSAAPVGVALGAGLHASRVDGSALEYNSAHPYVPDLLICRADIAETLLHAIAAQVAQE